MVASSVVGLSATVEILNCYMGEGRGSVDTVAGLPAQAITTFRKLKGEKNLVKMVFILYMVLCLNAH
jgi:hypothetical protein